MFLFSCAPFNPTVYIKPKSLSLAKGLSTYIPAYTKGYHFGIVSWLRRQIKLCWHNTKAG